MQKQSLPLLKNISLEQIEGVTSVSPNGFIGRFYEYQLQSHFQPIYSVAHRQIVGYEALVRPYTATGQFVAPNVLFESIQVDPEIVFLDRLARNLHVRNFMVQQPQTWLFLNVHARVAQLGNRYGQYFAQMLACHGLRPQQVVVELVENEIEDEAALADAMQYYRDLGCMVAIDDFGAGHSNFERLWRVQPHIVKLDRGLLVQAMQFQRFQRALPSLIALLHEIGCLTLIEGIENETEALLSIDSGVDFVQGYYFGKPALLEQAQANSLPDLKKLCQQHGEAQARKSEQDKLAFDQFYAPFSEASGMMSLGADIQDASKSLLMVPGVLRCYLLDDQGHQVGDLAISPQQSQPGGSEFLLSLRDIGFNRSRRSFFQRAMARPYEKQISRPYLSVIDARMCFTMSICIKGQDGAPYVFCADLLAD